MPSELPKDRSTDAQEVDPADLEEHPTDSIEENTQEADAPDAPSAEESTDPGVDDTVEILEGAAVALVAVREASTARPLAAVSTVAQNFDTFREAIEGAETVPDELTDLDEQEIERLAEAGLTFAKSLV